VEKVGRLEWYTILFRPLRRAERVNNSEVIYRRSSVVLTMVLMK